MIVVEGIENFRKVVLVISIVFSLLTLMIMIGQSSACQNVDIETALWLCFSIQITTFILLLFHYIGLAHIL